MHEITTDADDPIALAGATADERREFYRRRVGFYGLVGCLVSFGYWIVVNVLRIATGDDLSVLGHPANHVNLLVAGTFGGMAIATRMRRLPDDALAPIDALGTLLACGASAFYGWGANALDDSGYTAVLTITNILVFRSVSVPSTKRRTLAIGTSSALLALMCAVGLLASEDKLSDERLRLSLLMSVGWLAVAVTVATITSAVIYGLRRRVREAKRLGQYNLEERIGAGGMGEVYRASHALLRRPTAIKLLRPDAVSEAAIARFEQEVRLTSMLTHPNTIAIYDYGRTAEGIFYYAMEFLDGIDLESLIKKDGRQGVARVAHVLSQACGSLEEAHHDGLVHRDVKPANLMLCERGTLSDVVKVLDFGLVTDVRDPSLGGRVEASIVGTPHYMAPEAVTRPDAIDHRADIYALGAVAYFLLTGQTLFSGESVREILDQHVSSTPTGLARLPVEMQDILTKCLAKNPDGRFQSARELKIALERIALENPWTQADARAWWHRHRQRNPGRPTPGTIHLDDQLSPFLPTIEIDVETRR